jgi:ribosomal protein S21
MSATTNKLPFTRVTLKDSRGILELAINKFKKVVKDAGILQEYKDRMEYIKPSAIKRDMKLKAINRQKRHIVVD